MAIINAQNFLRWNDLNPSTAQPELPHIYRRDKGGAPYMPIAKPGEAMSFYINTEAGMTYSPFTDLKLCVINAKTNAVAADNIGTLNRHTLDIATGNYNIYSTFVVPALADGMYQLQVRRIASGVPLLTSNYVYVMNNTAYLDENTVFCRFRHDRYFYNIKYHELPGFYQQYRLHLSCIDIQPESKKELYEEVTTGKIRTYQNYLSKTVKMESYFFDDLAHEAATIMFEHGYLEINGRQYTAKNIYKINTIPTSVYAKGEIDLSDDAFSSVTRC